MKLSFKISQSTPYFLEKFIYPDYSKLKFKYLNENSKGLFSVNGSMLLLGSDIRQFKTLFEISTSDVKIECYNKGSLYFETEKTNITPIKDNKSFKQLELKLVAKTNYVSDEWRNFDKEYNINSVSPETNDLFFNQGSVGVERYSYEFSGRLSNNADVLLNAGKEGWDIEYLDINSAVWEDLDGWWEYGGTAHYIRQRDIGFYINSVKYEPTIDSGWEYIDNVVINGVTYPEYYRVTGTDDFGFYPSTEPWDSVNAINTIYDDLIINYTRVTRKLTDVIEFLIGEMGLTSVLFDNSGTTSDSFYSFKNMEGEDLTYGATTTNKMYSHLLLMNLTDFIPADDDGQNDIPASITNVSLKIILDKLLELGFDWFFYEDSGTFFQLLHQENKSLGSINPNLRDYYGLNRTYLENLEEKDEAEYFKIVNETTCKGINFIGTDVDFPNIITTTTKKTVTDNNFYFDLNDIANRRSDAYSDEDVNNLVLIAAQQDGTVKDYVREATSILTVKAINNSELSFSFLSKNILCNFPDTKFETNGASAIANDYRLKKRNKIALNIPINNLQTDFNVSHYVSIFGENAEFESLEQTSFNNIGKLTLKI